MSGFTDIHSHFVYGIDDGARSLDVMKAMLDAAYENNIRRLISTPHSTPGVKPFPQELFELHFSEAREYCAAMGYDIELLKGAEHLYTPALPGYADNKGLRCLGDSRYVLVEFIPEADVEEIFYAVDFLSSRGYIPLIAHVERYKKLSVKDALKLKDEYNIIFQMNCDTVIEPKGFLLKQKVRKYLKTGLISCIACDAHNCHSRPFNMLKAYESLNRDYGRAFADSLTALTEECVF